MQHMSHWHGYISSAKLNRIWLSVSARGKIVVITYHRGSLGLRKRNDYFPIFWKIKTSSPVLLMRFHSFRVLVLLLFQPPEDSPAAASQPRTELNSRRVHWVNLSVRTDR